MSQRFSQLEDLSKLPKRHAHGDLKVTNIRFDGQDETRVAGILDLDTFAQMPLVFEMGDAFRSLATPEPRMMKVQPLMPLSLAMALGDGGAFSKEVEADPTEIQDPSPGLNDNP